MINVHICSSGPSSVGGAAAHTDRRGTVPGRYDGAVCTVDGGMDWGVPPGVIGGVPRVSVERPRVEKHGAREI